MKKCLTSFLVLLAAFAALQADAAIPSNYYNGALGKSDRDLMLSLHQAINGHYRVYYSNLWAKFQTTDCNGTTIIDRYADTHFTYGTDQCGSGGYNAVGDCYNREHTIPHSWWGGTSYQNEETDTMYSDLYHLYPVDGLVNSRRGNYPLGDCDNGSAIGTGKLGTCTHSGYSGTVFEVADEYKGDFARSFFYMVVRYMHRVGTWTQDYGSAVFTSSSYKHLTPWAISQLLEWHRNDPVSTLERNRNEAVYGIQHNRNPFIDHPELAEFLWGNMTGTAWTGSATVSPVISAPSNGSTINVGTNTGNGVSKTITVKGVNLTKTITVSVTGTGFSVSPSTLTAAAVNAGTAVTVTYSGTIANASGRLTISSSEASSVVTLTANYNTGGNTGGTQIVETWEGCTGYGSYSNTSIQGHAFKWSTSDVGLYADDNRNDAQSCRFGNTATSFIAMDEDISDGVSNVAFYAAKWGSDAQPTLKLQYSTNGGTTWVDAGTCSPNATWQQYIFNLNVSGSVRIKILQTSGRRLNIDDIAITTNPAAPVEDPVLTIGAIPNIEVMQGNASPAVGVKITSENNSQAITLTVSGNFQISLDRRNWSNELTLDPSGETVFLRVKNTDVPGVYSGCMVARVGSMEVTADFEAVVRSTVTLGDVNKDGNVNISDVTALIDYLLGSHDDQAFDTNAADVNQDSSINISDVTMLIDMLLNGSVAMVLQTSDWDAVPAAGGIDLTTSGEEVIEIYDFDANLVATVHRSGLVELPAGIYVVTSETASRKVVVK